MNCTRCGEMLNEEEVKSPYEDSTGIICDECYHENYEEECGICEEYFDGDEVDYFAVTGTGKVNAFRAYNRERCLTPGVYKILGYPVYYQNIIGSGYVADSHVGYYLPVSREQRMYWKDEHQYPCVWVCRECVEALAGRMPVALGME